MSPEDILNLLQQNAPPGFKYCLTLVPIETQLRKGTEKSNVSQEHQ